jgi:hypothetical protein
MNKIAIGRNGLFGFIECEPSKFNETVTDYLMAQGLTAVLNRVPKKDSNENAFTQAEVLTSAQLKYDQLLAGIIKTRGARESDDPIADEAFKLAKAELIVNLTKLGHWPKKGEDKFQRAVNSRRLNLRQPAIEADDYVDLWVERNPRLLKQAAAIVEARQGEDVELPDDM